MATVANPFSQDEQNQGQVTTSTEGQGSSSPMSQGPQPQSNQPTGTSSGSFQNLNKYINANKGFNASSGGLAGTVSGNINNQAQTQQNNIQGAQNAFNQQANNNVNSFNNMGAVNQAANDPYGFLQNNPNGFQQVQAAENAQYTGPKGFEDLSGGQNLNNLNTQNANLNSLAKQTQTQSGQYGLLKQMFGSPSYTAGQQSLDQSIMNSAPGAQQQFSKARQTAAQAQQGLGVAEQQAQQQAQQNNQLAQQVSSNAKSTLNNAVSGVNSGIQNNLNKAIQSQKDLVTRAQNEIASGQISPEVYAALGGDKSGLATGQYLYGANPADFITKGIDPTAQQVATSTDYNKIQALNQLLGKNANENSSSFLQGFNDPSLAGTAGTGVNFNQAQLQNQIQAGKASYDRNVSGLQNEYNNNLNTVNSQIANLIFHQGGGNANAADIQGALANLNNYKNSLNQNYQGNLTNLSKMMGNKISLVQPTQTASVPSDQGVYQ